MARIKRKMPLYEFLKDSGNKKTGEIFPLSPEVAPKLLSNGVIRLVSCQTENSVKKEKPKGRPKKKK